MTVNVAFGRTTDAYLHSFDSNYTNARNGPADGINTGSTLYVGQNNNGGSYAQFQAMIAFDYTQPTADEIVTSAAVRVTPNVIVGSVSRNLEMRGYTWSTGGLVTGDWRNATNLSAAVLYAQINGLPPGAAFKHAYGGSDELLNLIPLQNYLELVCVTNRQRAGTVPTTDEGAAFFSADLSGTNDDPALVFVTVPRSAMFGVLGAHATLSDGTYVYLESTGAHPTPTYTLRHRDAFGASLGAVALIAGSTPNGSKLATPRGLNACTLTVDNNDTVFVAGRWHNNENTVIIVPFLRSGGVGSGTYTVANPEKQVPLPAYDTQINNVSMAWHPVGGGTLVIVASHIQGAGVSGGTGNEIAYACVSSFSAAYGAGTLVRGTGTVLGTLLPAKTSSDLYTSYANEVGAGLDVVADREIPAWGYLLSCGKANPVGSNAGLSLGRYVLNTHGSAFDHVSYTESVTWGYKDGNTKVRALPLGPGVCAAISTDADAGYGISINVRQHSGTTAGSTGLGTSQLSGESITSMPDGPTISRVSAWDAVYAPQENRIWIYYVDAANPRRLMRTAFSLSTMQALRNEVQVYLAPSGTATIQSVSAPRNAPVGQKGSVRIAVKDGSALSIVHVVDAFNIPPNMPTLTPRANFDATSPALFDWSFNDPNPGDAQGWYQLEISRVSDEAIVFNSMKTAGSATEYTLPGGTLTNGVDYRWRVQTWDAANEVSPWSGYGTFITSAGGNVTITDPAIDNVSGIITDDYPVAWSVSGTVQAGYRVWLYRVATGALVSDTGWVASTNTSATVSGMLSDVEYEVRVRVRNGSAVESSTATRRITPSYATPEIPLITVTPVPDEGYVLIDVENPPPGGPITNFPEYSFEASPDAAADVLTSSSITIVDSTDFAHRDARSAKHTTTATPAFSRIRSALSPGIIAGQRYTARAWIYSPTGYAGHVMAINWRPADPAGSTISTSTGPATQVPAGQWTLVSVTGTAPAGAMNCVYGPGFSPSPAAGYVFYVDELTMTGASDRPDVTRNDILRRRVGDGGAWDVIGSCGPDGSFRDYTARSGVRYEYMVRGVA